MRMKDIDPETLTGKRFTTEELADFLDVTAETIRRRIRNGQIPARRIPGEAGFTIYGEDLVETLDGIKYVPKSQRITSPPPASGSTRFESPQEAIYATKRETPMETPHPGGKLPVKLSQEQTARFVSWFHGLGVMIKELAERTNIRGDKYSRILNGTYVLTRPTLDAIRRAYGDGVGDFIEHGKEKQK